MKIDIDKIKMNNENPRVIKDNKFKKLVKSIKDFPEMLEKRPLIIDENNVVLGGNMRLKALEHLKYKKVPVIQVTDWSEEKKKEFIIKDNVGFGEWDWDILANQWNINNLNDWGLEVPMMLEENNNYTKKIEAPKYEPSDKKPTLKELCDDKKSKELIKKIENSNLNKNEKEFLKKASYRHIIFDYSKIADYYAHSDKATQELMEESALVIIDFEKAIELGYISLNEKITNQYIEEYGSK